MKEEMCTPTDECICGHMIKSHSQSIRWNKKRNESDCRLKCRYCKCNLLLDEYRPEQKRVSKNRRFQGVKQA